MNPTDSFSQLPVQENGNAKMMRITESGNQEVTTIENNITCRSPCLREANGIPSSARASISRSA
eukprot:7599056-Pyramimonas_sp.AAC.1